MGGYCGDVTYTHWSGRLVSGLVFLAIFYSSYLSVAIGNSFNEFAFLGGLIFVIPQAIVGVGLFSMNLENTGHSFIFDFIGIIIWLAIFIFLGWIYGKVKNRTASQNPAVTM